MKLFIACIALLPTSVLALDLLPIDKPNILPAPEIDGGMAVLTVALVGGIAAIVKRARDKANAID